MMRERLMIGQYYPTGSLIHRLDARAKIIASLLYMAALFVARGWLAYLGLGLVFATTMALARIPLRALARGMKLIVFFVLLTVLLNAFFSSGEVLWSWRSLRLYRDGLIQGLMMGLRLLLLVAFASLLTLSTAPLEMTDGLERLLKPFRRIGVPAHEIAMMMSIALRFIPTIMEEFDRIVLAQRARGSNIGQGGLVKRLNGMLPLLVPLFVAAFRRAEELAQAMEAKCYRGGAGRTRWRQSRWRAADTLYLALFGAILLAMIGLRIFVW